MGSAPPRTCFQMLPSPEVLGLNAQHSSRPSGSVAWACSFEPVPSGQGLLAPLLPAIDGPPVAPPPAGRHPAIHPGGRNGQAVPFSPSVSTTRGPGGARAGGNQKLDPPPGPGYLSIPPAAPFRPTHAGPRLRLSFDSGPPAQLTGTGLHTPWAWDRLGPTSAHDCGCSSTPGLRPSRPELTPAQGCGCFLRLRASGPADSDSRRPTTAAVSSTQGLRPSRPGLTPAHECGCSLTLGIRPS